MEDESERRITSGWRLFCETLLTSASIWTVRSSILKFRKLGTPFTSCRSCKWSSPFVKDDVLSKLADPKDVRVKCSSRSDAAVAHPSGFVNLGLRGTEGKKATMLPRSDCYNCTELSTLTALMAGDFFSPSTRIPFRVPALVSSHTRQRNNPFLKTWGLRE